MHKAIRLPRQQTNEGNTYPTWWLHCGPWVRNHFSKTRPKTFAAKPKRGRIRNRAGRTLWRR